MTALKSFFNNICVSKLSDLHFQNSQDLLGAVQLPDTLTLCGTNLSRLSKLLDYASEPAAKIPALLTMAEVIIELRNRDGSNSSVGAAGSHSTGGNHDSSFKTLAPTLKAFLGHESDFWVWYDHVYDEFGQSNMKEALKDKDFFKTYPKQSNAGFFSLSKALKKGALSYLPRKVENKTGRTSAFDLYCATRETFNTDAARAHMMVHSIDSALCLDHTVEDFIEDWYNIVARLEHNGCRLALERDVLCAFLLRALKGDEYSKVRQ